MSESQDTVAFVMTAKWLNSYNNVKKEKKKKTGMSKVKISLTSPFLLIFLDLGDSARKSSR